MKSPSKKRIRRRLSKKLASPVAAARRAFEQSGLAPQDIVHPYDDFVGHGDVIALSKTSRKNLEDHIKAAAAAETIEPIMDEMVEEVIVKIERAISELDFAFMSEAGDAAGRKVKRSRNRGEPFTQETEKVLGVLIDLERAAAAAQAVIGPRGLRLPSRLLLTALQEDIPHHVLGIPLARSSGPWPQRIVNTPDFEAVRVWAHQLGQHFALVRATRKGDEDEIPNADRFVQKLGAIWIELGGYPTATSVRAGLSNDSWFLKFVLLAVADVEWTTPGGATPRVAWDSRVDGYCRSALRRRLSGQRKGTGTRRRQTK